VLCVERREELVDEERERKKERKKRQLYLGEMLSEIVRIWLQKRQGFEGESMDWFCIAILALLNGLITMCELIDVLTN